MKKIVVTGGTGFIGKAVIKNLLKNGYNPFILTRSPDPKNSQEILCNILDESSVGTVFAKIQPDILIHLAWNVEPPHYLHSDDNMEFLSASMHLLKQFKLNGGKQVLFSGTCFEYKFLDSPLFENSQLDPHTLYASTKAALYLVAKQYAEQNQLIFSWMRFFYLFGENENSKRVVPYIITSLISNQNITCKNSSAVRDYIYVDDAARAVISIMDNAQNGVFNIGSGSAITMRDIFAECAKMMGKEHLVTYEEQPVIPKYILADISKLREIGFSPSALSDSLSKTINWWKGQIIT